jgi:hypothetical protein
LQQTCRTGLHRRRDEGHHAGGQRAAPRGQQPDGNREQNGTAANNAEQVMAKTRATTQQRTQTKSYTLVGAPPR